MSIIFQINSSLAYKYSVWYYINLQHSIPIYYIHYGALVNTLILQKLLRKAYN
jgi:hypothetical protein